MPSHPINESETIASSIEDTSFEAAVFGTAVERCFEKLDRLVTRLHRYPLDAICAAMGMYLQEMLSFMLDERHCTAEEIREFLRNIESGAFAAQGVTEKQAGPAPAPGVPSLPGFAPPA